MERRRASSATDEGADARASTATERRSRLPSAMATLSDLKEVKEALNADLVSQAEYDDVKRDYLRAKKDALEFQKRELRAKEVYRQRELHAKEVYRQRELHAKEVYLQRELHAKEEFQKKELRAKEEALEFQKKGISEFQKKELRAKEETLEFQKKELRAKEEALEFQKRELIAKETFQQKKSEADLRAYALESIVKHGSSLMSEEQKVDLVRDYAKMSGLDGSAEKDAPASKRQRPVAEERNAAPPQIASPASTSAATNQAPGAPAPAPCTSTRGVVINEGAWHILHMSGLDRGATERDALASQPSYQIL